MNEVNKELLEKYIKGECSHEERQCIEKWLLSTENDITELNDVETQEMSKQLDLAWLNIEDDQRKMRVVSLNKWRSIAAIFILIIGTGLLFYWLENTKNELPINNNLAFVTNKLKDSFDFQLSDGSVLTLFKESQIHISKNFNVSQRHIDLIYGKVKFAIHHNKESSFTVNTPHSVVQVLGTTFVLDINPKKQTLSLLEGRVSFAPNGKDATILHPGQKISYDIQSRIIKLASTQIKTTKNVSHTFSSLKFDDTPLRKVFSALEDRFDVRVICLDKDILDWKYSGNLDNKSLNDIEEILSIASDIQFKEQVNTIYVKTNNPKMDP